MNEIKNEVIKDLLLFTQKEIEKQKILIAFYKARSIKQEKEEGAKSLLKAKQIEEQLKFNEDFYGFISE